MEKQKNSLRVGFSKLLWAIILILICVAPCLGEDIDGDVPGGFLDVYGTVNLLPPGANVDFGVTVYPNGVLNIYAGTVGFLGITLVEPTPEFPGNDPVVTVYGTDFALDGVLLDPLATQFFVDPFYGGVLTGTYGNGDPIDLLIDLLFYSDVAIYLQPLDTQPPDTEMTIDIKPGCDKNNINLKSKGVVPVAVLTTDDFDAGTIDPATVEFAGAEPMRSMLKDVDRDGDKDMLFLFRTRQLNLDQDSTEATLTAQINDGTKVSGTDEVRIVPSRRRCRRNKFSRW